MPVTFKAGQKIRNSNEVKLFSSDVFFGVIVNIISGESLLVFHACTVSKVMFTRDRFQMVSI